MKPSYTEVGNIRSQLVRIWVSCEHYCFNNFIRCKTVWSFRPATSIGFSITKFSSLFTTTMTRAFPFYSMNCMTSIKCYFFNSFILKKIMLKKIKKKNWFWQVQIGITIPYKTSSNVSPKR